MLTLSDFDDRFFSSIVLDGFDYESQLRAMNSLIWSHQIAQQKNGEEIEDIRAFADRAKGYIADRAVDDYVDHLHNSVFQDAAYSMAAVGMIAPFVEALFRKAFYNIGEFQQEREGNGQSIVRDQGHKRWRMVGDKQWDCNYVSNGRRNIVAGITELAAATGLCGYLPNDVRRTLDALFSYRNKMLHGGFEWDRDDIVDFKASIKNNGWPTIWFTASYRGEEEWIFYMTQEFVDHCFAQIDHVLNGVGAYVKCHMIAD